MTEQQKSYKITVKAPMNIALIKYWGKRNEELMLPLNDSISININSLYSTTTVTTGPQIHCDSVTVNDDPVKLGENSRYIRVFEELRRLVRKRLHPEHVYNQPDIPSPFWHIQIVSKNNFPTAAGLASSASGFAAIAFALGQLFHLPEKEVVRLARLGSGSACRSVLEGFVQWKAGFKESWDSTCESIFPSSYWPNLRAVVIVCSTSEKDIGSTSGMKNSLATCCFMKTRVEEVVPFRVKELTSAIESRNFARLAEVVMQESNQLHAICLDTWPPLHYLNDSSRQIIRFVHAFNNHFGIRLAYTFDAGPNGILFMENETFPLFIQTFVKACDFELPKSLNSVNNELAELESEIPKLFKEPLNIEIRDMIVSKLGEKPMVIPNL